MAPHAFGEIREAHLMLGNPFSERQAVKHFLFGHLVGPFNEHVPDLKAALKKRTNSIRRHDSQPAQGNDTKEPS
jgi:hypothetical protein